MELAKIRFLEDKEIVFDGFRPKDKCEQEPVNSSNEGGRAAHENRRS